MYCQFGNELDVRLRDQLVSWLRTDSIRKRVIENDAISFSDALKRANDFERIARESKVVVGFEMSVSGESNERWWCSKSSKFDTDLYFF